MIFDTIVAWPKNCDYPLWRDFVRKERKRMNEVIVSFTETNTGEDYRDFVRQAMFPDYVHFVEATQPGDGEDWRNLAIHDALLHSYNAPWLWFTEQDFYPQCGFWQKVEELEAQGNDVIAVYQQKRMHPCCIFIKREALEKTRKNFGIVPDISDHFSIIQKDLENAGVKIAKIPEDTYFHYNGLSHNWRLLSEGLLPNYEMDKFMEYLDKCLKVKVELSEVWAEKAVAGLEKTYGNNTWIGV